jgi:hypothetical protein
LTLTLEKGTTGTGHNRGLNEQPVEQHAIMRLWSLHPRYLDARGLVALWREALLAQKVLAGGTKGYRHHPQLRRFRRADNPPGAIAAYLREVAREAQRRGYQFNSDKIINEKAADPMPVTQGQLRYEFTHLLKKLEVRDPAPHPLFDVIDGGIEDWEVL